MFLVWLLLLFSLAGSSLSSSLVPVFVEILYLLAICFLVCSILACVLSPRVLLFVFGSVVAYGYV